MFLQLGLTSRTALFAAYFGLATACAQPTEEEATTEAAVHTTLTCDQVSQTCFQIMAPPDKAEACPLNRVIGVRSGAICPPPHPATGGIWVRSSLFTGGPVPPELAKYCMYDWIGSNPPDTTGLPAAGHPSWSDWLSPDCNVVGAAGTEMMDLIWEDMRDAYYEQIQRVSTLPFGTNGPTQTRVEVIDSSVTLRTTGNPSHGQFDHGRAVGLVVDRLTCPEGASAPCGSFVASTLALRLERTEEGIVRTSTAAGGFFGSQGDLAIAIFNAVDRWRATAPGDKLIINLSLAWDPRWGGNYPGNNTALLEPPVRAVHSAITYATCSGALVIAAAGNVSGGPEPKFGPMYPAAWEKKDAPTVATCASFAFGGGGAPSGAYAPLLHAAGGVGGADELLANARAGARARLAAPAANVVVNDPQAETPYSSSLTGTSMAAAGVSSAAALVWAYRPGWNRFQVMQAVYNSAIDLGTPADFCLGTSCANTRRISMCRAINEACLGGGARCPQTPLPCASAPAFRDATMPPPDLSALSITATVSARRQRQELSFGWPCSSKLIYDGNLPDDPCVAEQYYSTGTVPWVGPQPDNVPCHKCVMANAMLTIAVDTAYAGTLTSPTLTLILPNGNEVRLDLSDSIGPLDAGDTTKVLDLPYDSRDVTSASLEFLVDGESSVKDTVMLY